MNKVGQGANKNRWLSWIIVSLGSIPVLCSLFGLLIVRASEIDRTAQDLERTATSIAHKLDQYFLDKAREVQYLVDTLADMKYIDDGKPWSIQVKRFQQVYPLYDWIGVLDAGGRVVAATDSTTRGFDIEERSWLKRGGGGSLRRPYVDALSEDLPAGENAVVFIQSITAESPGSSLGLFGGFVVVRIKTEDINNIVMRFLNDERAAGQQPERLEYQLVTRHNRLLASSFSVEDEPAGLFAHTAVVAQALASGKPGSIWEGPIITRFAQMPSRQTQRGLGWSLLLRLNYETVQGSYQLVTWMIIVGSAILSVVITAVLLWSSRRLVTQYSETEVARQVAHENEEFLQYSLDALTSHIAILDEHATIITVNKAWKLFGEQNQLRDPGHAIGQNYLDVCQATSGEEVEVARAVADAIRALQEGHLCDWSTVYPCHSPDMLRWFVVRMSKFTIGGKLRIVVDHRDVTANWLDAQSIRASQEATQVIINSSFDAHILMDSEGLIVGWNPKAEAIFGWPSEVAMGQPLGDLIIPPGYREAHRRGLRKFLSTGNGLLLDKRIESEGWHKDGHPFPIEMTVTAIERPNGYLFSTFARDITQQKKEERCRTVELQISKLLVEATSLDVVAQDIIGRICDLLEWKLGVLWQVDKKAQVLRYETEWKISGAKVETFLEQTRCSTFACGVGLPGRVWESGTVGWISDVIHDSNFSRAAFAEADGLHAAVAVPVKMDGEVQIVIELFADAVRPPDQQLVNLFDGVAAELSSFLMRQRSAQLLRRSEARFSGILQLADEAIVTINDSQQIVLFNRSAQRIFGYTAEEALGQPLSLLIPDEFRAAHHCYVSEFASDSTAGRPMNDRREIKGRRKNGEEFPAEASIAKVSVEGQTTYTAILRDISERKKEEQSLRDAKALADQAVVQWMALLATVETFFIEVSEAGAVSQWTGKAEKIFDIPLSEAIGRTLQDLSISWSREAIQEAISRATKTRSSVYLGKVLLLTPENRQRFLKLTVTPLFKESGVAVIIMGEDITDHLLLEHDLAQSQKLESIGRLAAGIAHEINTPTQFVGDNLRFFADSFSDLMAVFGRQQAVLCSVKTGTCSPDLIAACEAESQRVDLDFLIGEIPKAIAQSTEGVARIASIVRAMKEFAHPGSDEKVCVDVNKAIESTVTVARNEWKYVADLTTDLASNLPSVPCLLGQFNQVILNMIVNAAHAIADVTKGTGAKGTILITTRAVDRWVEIRIADSGSGIPEEIRTKIFDPFFTTKAVGRGTGQGLAIAHSVIVDKHQGTIAVQSEVGRGSTFIVRLPLDAEATMTATEMAA